MNLMCSKVKFFVMILLTVWMGAIITPPVNAATYPTVTAVGATVYSVDNVVLEGELTKKGTYSIREYGFVWSYDYRYLEIGDSGVRKAQVGTGNISQGETFTYTIRNQSLAETDIYYKAYVKDTDGEYTYSGYKKFNPRSGESGSVYTDSANVISDSSAELSGSLSLTANVDSYGFYWAERESDLSSSSKRNTKRVSNISDGIFSATLTGLDSGTEYWYQAYAYFGGTEKVGTSKSFVAGDSSSNRPTLLTGSADYDGYHSATLFGEVTSNGGNSITEYGFYWGNSASNVNNNKETVGYDNIGLRTQFEATIKNLDADKTYYYRAYARNRNGVSYGTIKSFTSYYNNRGGNRPTVTTQTPKVTGNSAVLSGYIEDYGNSDISEHGFYWGKESDPQSRQKVGGYIDKDKYFDYTVYNLDLGSTYYVKAYARNSNGESTGSVVSFRAGGNVNVALTTQVNNIAGGGATLLGTIDSVSANDTITAYGFYWGQLNGAETEVKLGTSISTGTTFSYFLSGLEIGKTYVARAYAKSGSNTYLGNQITINPNNTGSISSGTTGAPVISISAPAPNTAVAKGSMMAINAAATPGGSNPIMAMGLYVNGTQMARPESSVLSYSLDTSNLPLGTNIIKVTGWDGVRSGEQNIAITLTAGGSTPDTGGTAPAVAIQNPANFEIIKKGTLVEIKASAVPGSDNIPIQALGLYLYDQRLMRIEGGSSFTYYWDTSNVNSGQYVIQVTGWNGVRQGEKLITVTVQ